MAADLADVVASLSDAAHWLDTFEAELEALREQMARVLDAANEARMSFDAARQTATTAEQ